MSKEKITANWFKTRYKLMPNGFFLPVSQAPVEDYDPFNMFINENEESDNLYLLFINTNVDEIAEIESFYNRFGPLGMMSRNYGSLTKYESDLDLDPNEYPKEEPLVFNKDGAPLSQVAEWYKFKTDNIWKQYSIDGRVPDTIEIQKLAGEDSEDFKREHTKYKGLINLYISIKEGDIKQIQDNLALLYDDMIEESEIIETPIERWWNNLKDSDDLKIRALEVLTGYLNKEIAEGAKLKLVIDPVSLDISKELQWKCDSLLGAMYLMFINNIADGIQIRSCINCRNYYRGGRPEMKYCGTPCQSRAKTKRYLDQIKTVRNMYAHGKSVKEIADELNKDEQQIKKWIDS